MSVKRTSSHGGLAGLGARVARYEDILGERLAARCLELAVAQAPYDEARDVDATGPHLRDTGTVRHLGHGHWATVFTADHAAPVELGHRVFNQYGGPYGWVPPDPFLGPAFGMTVAELSTHARAAWREAIA